MKKPIVVTGAGGFVGSNVTRRLIKNGFQVHAIVRGGSDLWRLNEIQKKIIIHTDLLSEPERLKLVLKKIKPAAIYHLATYGSYPHQNDINLAVSTNITGLINLLEASREINYVRFLVSGSSSEYGKTDMPMKETDLCKPNNMYAACKLAATNIALMYSRAYGKPVTVLRLFNVYGCFEAKGRLVRNVIEAVINSQPILMATGREVRDFINTDDVNDAFIQATKSDKALDGEIFNIATGVETTVLELAEKVMKLTGVTVPIEIGRYAGRVWDSFHWRGDTGKTKKILKWKPASSLTVGLQKTIAWYKQHT